MPFATLAKFFLVFSAIVILLFSCGEDPRNKSHATVPLSSINKGKALAARYCGSCHQVPEPSLLDAGSWEKGVLPQMGPRLGIFRHQKKTYPSHRNDPSLTENVYPEKPVLSSADWQHIIDYYTATAPDTLLGQGTRDTIQPYLPLFAAVALPLQYQNSMTSYVKIAPPYLPYSVVVSDAARMTTFFLDNSGKPVDSMRNGGAVVDMVFQKDSILATNIGIMYPNNGRFGKADLFQLKGQKWSRSEKSLFADLQRPVQIIPEDLNGDGIKDYLICAFGYVTGALFWMEGDRNGQFVRRTLRPLPGATRAYITDWNRDGLPDICVLFAQGDEGIWLYTNKGGGKFDERRLLQFPPVYGSSYFELADFNRDGHPDIVYTCGDNADFSLVLKPYHGVYIFINDGRNSFRQQYFFPINGCYKAVARDFDGDGDLDLAAIAFFADYTTRPEEGFVYLENRGSFRFLPFTLPEAKKGRWLTMDAGDFDRDGKIDIVLGNFDLGPNLRKSKEDWSKAPPVLLLKNTSKK